MKITNKLGLPQPLYDAVKNDGYSRGGANISITALLKPPRITALEAKHWDDLEEDCSDRIWSLMGQIVHGLLERADNTGTAEQRLFTEVDGWTISGQVDRYIDGVIEDYKFITAWKFKGGVPSEHEEQLNLYAELLRRAQKPVRALKIVGILRDWSKLEARRDPAYPQTNVIVLPVNLWPEDKARDFLVERVRLHRQARLVLPECTPEERWAKPSVYALMKKDGKKALKLYDSEEDAKAHAATAPNLYVVHRPGSQVRCENYCSVSNFCSFWQGQQSTLKAETSQEV